MKIVVCVKQTFDTEAKITLSEEGCIDDRSVLQILNPYDEYAVEEGIRLKEKYGGEVSAVSVGHEGEVKALQHCLAMGADHAILVADPQLERPDSHSYAVMLSRVIKTMEYDLILCGRISIDSAGGEVPARLAELLDLPQVTAVSKLRVNDDRSVEAWRDVEGGVEIVESRLPVVVSVQKGINEVRYPSLRLVMQAKKTPIRTFTPTDLELNPDDVAPFVENEGYVFPPPREQGIRLSGSASEVVAELMRRLADEQKVV